MGKEKQTKTTDAKKRRVDQQWARTYANKKKTLSKLVDQAVLKGENPPSLIQSLEKYKKDNKNTKSPRAPQTYSQRKDKLTGKMMPARPGRVRAWSHLTSCWKQGEFIGWEEVSIKSIPTIDPETQKTRYIKQEVRTLIRPQPKSGHFPPPPKPKQETK